MKKSLIKICLFFFFIVVIGCNEEPKEYFIFHDTMLQKMMVAELNENEIPFILENTTLKYERKYRNSINKIHLRVLKRFPKNFTFFNKSDYEKFIQKLNEQQISYEIISSDINSKAYAVYVANSHYNEASKITNKILGAE